MDLLDIAWKKALRKRGVFGGGLAFALVFIGFCASNDQEQIRIQQLFLWQLAGAVCGLCICLAVSSRWNRRRKMTKLLSARGLDAHSLERICQELQTANLCFYNNQYRMSLYMTKEWFLLISTNASFVCRRAEIRYADREFLPERSDQLLRLYLFDGTVFRCKCTDICEKVVESINKELKGAYQ